MKCLNYDSGGILHRPCLVRDTPGESEECSFLPQALWTNCFLRHRHCNGRTNGLVNARLKCWAGGTVTCRNILGFTRKISLKIWIVWNHRDSASNIKLLLCSETHAKEHCKRALIRTVLSFGFVTQQDNRSEGWIGQESRQQRIRSDRDRNLVSFWVNNGDLVLMLGIFLVFLTDPKISVLVFSASKTFGRGC